MISARVRTASVLASPGTPSSRMWPPVSSPTRRRSTMASWPTIRRETSFRIRCTGSVSAGLSVSFGALTLLAPESRRGKDSGRSAVTDCRRAPAAGFSRRPGSSRMALYSADSSAGVSGRYRPGGQVAQADRAVGEPGQAVHLEPHRLAPAPHDPVSALAQASRPGCSGPRRRDAPGPRSGTTGRPSITMRPRTACGDLRGRTAVHQRGVAAGNVVARMGEPVHRFAVGGQQQQPGGHHVEPADVGEARVGSGMKSKHGAAAFFVARRW